MATWKKILLEGEDITVSKLTIGSAEVTEAALEILDGATVTTTELNYVDGVTSAIQTQLDAKLPKAGGTLTGNLIIDGSSSRQIEFKDGSTSEGAIVFDETTNGLIFKVGGTSGTGKTDALKIESTGALTSSLATGSTALTLANSSDATAIFVDNNNNSVTSALINIHGYNSTSMANFKFIHGWDSNANATKFEVKGDGSATFAGDVTISGDLAVSGSQSYSTLLAYNASGSGVVTAKSEDDNVFELVANTDENAYLRASDDSIIYIGHTSSNKLTIANHGNGGNATFAGNVTSSGSGDHLITVQGTGVNDDAYFVMANSGDNNNTWAIGRPNDGKLYITHSTGATHNASTQTIAMQMDTSHNTTFAGTVGLNGLTNSSYDASADDLVLGSTSGNGGLTIVSGTSNVSYINFADGTTGSERYRAYLYHNRDNDEFAMVNFSSGSGKYFKLHGNGNIEAPGDVKSSGGHRFITQDTNNDSGIVRSAMTFARGSGAGLAWHLKTTSAGSNAVGDLMFAREGTMDSSGYNTTGVTLTLNSSGTATFTQRVAVGGTLNTTTGGEGQLQVIGGQGDENTLLKLNSDVQILSEKVMIQQQQLMMVVVFMK